MFGPKQTLFHARCYWGDAGLGTHTLKLYL